MKNVSRMNDKERTKFVRYAEGAKMYGMGISKFQQLAKDAKECYKVKQMVLVNISFVFACCGMAPSPLKHPLYG